MLRLRTFGCLMLERDGAPYTGRAAQRRRLALLALLAASETGVSRERLRSYLWPEADDLAARHSLDDALSALRRELRSEALFLGVMTLRPNAELLSSDFGDHAAAVRSGDAERAASLYTGPFLDGFSIPGAAEFELWVEAERTRRAQVHARMLRGLAAAATERGDTAAAVQWSEAHAALDRLDTPATLGLVAALAADGRRHEALRVAKSHEALVRAELEVDPGREWAAAVDQLRRELTRPSVPAVSCASSRVFRPAGARASSAATSQPAGFPRRTVNRWVRRGSLVRSLRIG